VRQTTAELGILPTLHGIVISSPLARGVFFEEYHALIGVDRNAGSLRPIMRGDAQ